MSGYATFEGKGDDGKAFTIESNSQSSAEMARNLGQETPKEPKVAAVEAQADGDGGEVEEAPPTAHEANGEAKKANPKHDMKARMLQATEQAAQAKKERDEYKAKADRADEIERRSKANEEELARLRPKEPVKVEPKPAEGKPRPVLADFPSIEDHAEAVAEWVADKREASAKEARQTADTEARKVQVHQAFHKRADTFGAKLTEAMEKDPLLSGSEMLKWVPAFLVGDPAKVDQKAFIAQQFIDREKGLDLLMYLKDHPDDVARISVLNHPAKIEYALDVIEQTLGVATTATMPESSKAAPPARSVTGGPPIGNADPSKMSFEEYAKWQDADDKRHRKAAR